MSKKPNITDAQVADALEKCVKKKKWGDNWSCPLCILFNWDLTRCDGCEERTGLGGCSPFCPPGFNGAVKNTESYFRGVLDYELGDDLATPRQLAAFRRAANKALLARAKELRGNK